MENKTTEKTGCLGILFPFLNRFFSLAPKQLPYRLRDDFLSPAELSVYKILTDMGQEKFSVLTKVRLADIFFVSRPNENISYFNRISQRHIDFLICDPKTLKPQLGIELDDSSHKRNKTIERDRFIEQVFQVANLPLLRIPARREYQTKDIETQIDTYLSAKSNVDTETSDMQSSISGNFIPFCPKCNIPMVLRKSSQGEHKGELFYGCKNYPRCREVKPYQPEKNE